MRVDIQCSPAYSIAYCFLSVGEKIRAESGAMALMSSGLNVSVDAGPGGVVKGLLRKGLAGESFFMATYTARMEGAWVAVAPRFPGDVELVEMREGDEGMYVQGSSLLAMSASLSDNVRFSGVGNMVMQEGAIAQHVSGAGQLLLSSYGGMQTFQLRDRESLIVDTGHIVAMTDGLRDRMRVGPLAGVVKSALSGEGLVAELTGPGTLIAQTRAESALRSWLMPDRKDPRSRH